MSCTKKLTAVALALLVLALCSSSCPAWDTSTEIRRLNKEAPSIDGFSGAKALMWLRDSDFKMLTDGTMYDTRRSVVMMGEFIPADWKEMKLPVPYGGTLDITEAAWYNPMTGLKEGELEVLDETLEGGAAVKVIKTPEAATGRAVVLIVNTTYSKRYGVDETIALAGPLPIWEQNVTIEAPEGRELYWMGKGLKNPVVTKESGSQVYKWNIMNQSAWHGEGFVEYKRPSVSFSFRKGIAKSLETMNETAAMVPTLPLPQAAAKLDKTKAGIKLMEWIAAPARTLAGYPRNFVRPAGQIPAEGPWTPWEQTLILNKWLKQLGWTSTVWWQAVAELDNNAPSSTSLWVAPVLELDSSGGKTVFYQAGQASAFGVTSPSIAGSHIYHSKGAGEYEHTPISAGGPSNHRLSLVWVLNLDENGRADGKLSVNVNGGWAELMSNGHIPTQSRLGEFLLARINFAIPGMSLTPTSVTPTNTGYKLEFDVKCAPGIVHGGNLLLRLPGGVPSRVSEMIDRESDYTFKFPFIIDQKIRMQMPGGYKMLQAPPLKRLGEGTKAVLKESITHWPKKAQLIADSTWTVKNREIDAATVPLLKEELGACLRWPVLDIPFRK